MLNHRKDDGAGDGLPPAGLQQGTPEPRPRRALGPIAGWTAAALISIGLALWVGGGRDREFGPAPAPAPPTATSRSFAPPQPDAAQIRRAYEQVRDIYAERGFAGVSAFSASCSDSLRADPRVLDYCLAFDLYAAALARGRSDAAARAWLTAAPSRELELAREAMPPGADPAARLAQVRGLARQVSVAAPPAAPLRPRQMNRPTRRTHDAARQPAVHRPRAAPRPQPARTAAASRGPCRLRSTPAERVVCAHPDLARAEARMRAAYRQAAARGASLRRLERDQARWRVAVNAAAPDRGAVARLYAQRTRELQRQVRRR